MSEVTYNAEQKLFVIPTGNGFTCLGLEYAIAETEKMAHELHTRFHVNVNVDSIRLVDPMDAWKMRERVTAAAKAIHDQTGARFEYGLHPQLKGLEGWRVEVVENRPGDSQTRRRFIVGRSTGWAPVHLEIRNANSSGGEPAPSSMFASVTKIERVR